MDGQPGDKSPGYYRVSLRDEGKTGFQMSKLPGPSGRKHNGAKHVHAGKFGCCFREKSFNGLFSSSCFKKES